MADLSNSSHRLTPALEDCLKAIFLLAARHERVTTAHVAAALSMTQPSATELFQRLAEQGFIAYARYYGATLTDAGRLVALAVLRRQRLLESFLVDALGYRWDEVLTEADVLEHAISPLLEARIAARLGHPTRDPHGDPIPQADGTLPSDAGIALTALPLQQPARIVQVTQQAPDQLCYLAELGLIPGQVLQVLQRAPFDGPVTVAVGSTEHVLAADLAQTISAAPLAVASPQPSHGDATRNEAPDARAPP